MKISSLVEKVLQEEALSTKMLKLFKNIKQITTNEVIIETNLLFFTFFVNNRKITKKRGNKYDEYKTTSLTYEHFIQAEDKLSAYSIIEK